MPRKIDYFCSDTIRQDLKGKTVRGGVYTALGQGGVTCIQLATMPILARLLTKGDFGLVAMAVVFTGFAELFVDAGMSLATVQRPKVTHMQVSNLFWVSSALGGGMALLTIALSPAIGWFYARDELIPVVIALAVPFVFAGLTSQHRALLIRAMMFKQLAIVQVGANLVARCAAVYVAWRYQTYWALVVGTVSTSLVAMFLTWSACRWIPSLPRRGSDVGGMVRFGANLTGFNVVNYVARNADSLLIGRFWGDAALGVYDQAYKLFMTPMRRINGPLGAVAIPALSRLVDEPQKYRNYYLGLLRRFALVTVPLAVFLCVCADLIIPWYLGPGWDDSVLVLRALSIAGALQAVGTTSGWLFVSQGRAWDRLVWVMCYTPIVVSSFLAGLPWGPAGVAISYAIATSLLGFPLQLALVGRKGPVGPSCIARALATPAVLGLGVLGGAAAAKTLSASDAVSQDLLAAAVGAVVVWWLLALSMPPTRQDLRRSLLALRAIRS